MLTPAEYLAENRRRLEAAAPAPYDPLTGLGADGPRVPHTIDGRTLYLPRTMTDDVSWPLVRGNAAALERLRLRHDFEYWAARCARIPHKGEGRVLPFILNAPQRTLLAALERQRRARQPIRAIVLKARQWGSSTLVLHYMAWMQMVVRQHWSSVICAHYKDTASAIRMMYDRLLSGYPEELLPAEGSYKLTAAGSSRNIRELQPTGAIVMIGSAENGESFRGTDIAMAHLSEVGFWRDAAQHDPADLVRAISSGVARVADTVIVMESTANGVGTFFHKEWLRAEQGESDKVAVFIPWYAHAAYRAEVADSEVEAFVSSWSPYERALWEQGLTLQQIRWYRDKLREAGSATKMMAEYPGTPVEAFAGTGAGVFGAEQVEALATTCCEPVARGEVHKGEFCADASGALEVWQHPVPGAQYIATVDVGGRSRTADWSVVLVMRRGEHPEVVAQWRGHLDHDLLAERAETLARYYHNALLVVESNTLETESYNQPAILLQALADRYPNLYWRDATHPGFHTNVQTKALALGALIAAVRTRGYVERSRAAANELATYEQLPNGSCRARRGCHDDMLMTRAIALHVLATEQPSTAAPAPPPARRWL